MGYHNKEIERGVYGTPSKIKEECEEFLDACEQSNRIMALVELSDLVGAIRGYLKDEYEGQVGMTDLIEMSFATERAFKDGTRKPRG